MLFLCSSSQRSTSSLVFNQKNQQIQKERGVIGHYLAGFMNVFVDRVSYTYLGGVSNVSF